MDRNERARQKFRHAQARAASRRLQSQLPSAPAVVYDKSGTPLSARDIVIWMGGGFPEVFYHQVTDVTPVLDVQPNAPPTLKVVLQQTVTLRVPPGYRFLNMQLVGQQAPEGGEGEEPTPPESEPTPEGETPPGTVERMPPGEDPPA